MMVGLKFKRTPYSLNTTLIELPPPLLWTTGIGNSPPARKLAVWPFIAIRFGSARARKAPFVLRARMKAAVLSPVLKRNRFTAEPAKSAIVPPAGPRRKFCGNVPGPPPCANTEVLLRDAYD